MGKIKLLSGALALAAFLAACGGGEPISGDFVPNSPPDTDVSATPPVLASAGFEVSFNWTGSDPDGEVSGFEWRISSNGRDGIVDVQDTLEAYLPWRFTTVTDSTFLVDADLDGFPADVQDPRQGPSNWRYWQTHTFYIRAIDDNGRRDPSPAHVSFTATTLAPTVRINLPDITIPPDCIQGPKVLTFGWTATDPDFITSEPAFIRYVLKPFQAPGVGGCITRTLFETMNPSPITSADFEGQPWIRWDAADDSARIVTFDKQEPGATFLFAVQAKDVANAVTPTFVWGRNVRHVQTSNNKFPLLTVTERFLGSKGVVDRSNLVEFDIAQDQPLEFTWSAAAGEYAGIIDAYRFGWDVADPEDSNDPGWAVNWGNTPAHRRASNSFQQGTHNLVVQCRDNSGTISRYVAVLNVIQVPSLDEQRSLLLVDDWKEDNPGGDGDFDAEWDDGWRDILQGVVGFQNADMVEASNDRARVTFARAVEYRSIIWFISASNQSFMHTDFAPINSSTPQFNWLEIYQARVGNLLLVGPGAMRNSVEDAGYVFPLVFNVPAFAPLGFGTYVDIDGTRKNRGTLRFPYTGWCLDLSDMVRPAVGSIFGEHEGSGGVRVRTGPCDALHTAQLDTFEFTRKFPTALEFGVGDLRPNAARLETPIGGDYDLLNEEIYNKNVTARSVSLVPRPCQLPMYRWKARRDMGAGPPGDPKLVCLPRLRETSSMDLAPCGIVSSVYSASKPVLGASDFLWGFQPFAFNRGDISRAVNWILGENWGIQIQQ